MPPRRRRVYCLALEQRVRRLLVGSVHHRADVAQGGRNPGGEAGHQPLHAAGAAEISKNGHTAYATVIFSSTKHAGEAKTLAKDVSNAHLSVETGDTAFTKVGGAGASDVIGVLAALLILMLVFRSAWAALLPIITGVAGVGISSLVVLLLSHAVDHPERCP